MKPFFESDYEEAFVQKLQAAGWAHKFGAEISRRVDDAVLRDDLRAFLRSHYADKGLTEEEYGTIIARVENVPGDTGYRQMVNTVSLVREGYVFTPAAQGLEPFHLDYIDFVHLERNIFRAVNQFEFHQGVKQRIPDVVLFVNGIPLVIVELKNPTNRHATVRTAHSQIYKRYWGDIPAFMRFCALAVVSDGAETRLGTSVSAFEYFYAWKKVENGDAVKEGLGELDTMIAGALKPERLLEIFRDFLFFPDPAEGEERELAVVCRYPQFFAARKLKDSILKALGAASNQGGLYFGATGCGKTYTMLFLARLLSHRCLQKLGSPTIILIVDREDLESQAGRLFCNARTYLADENVRVFESRDDLANELKSRKAGGFYITTIQKFTEKTGLLSDRKNIICMSDEAHRTQNNIGSKLKTTDLGAFVSYGFAKHLRDALPNAVYTGFTGTPIDEAVQVFGGIVDQYTMREAQRDGITVGICYDPRLARVFLDKTKTEAIERFYRQCEQEGTRREDVESSKRAMSEMRRILSDPDVLRRVARDVVQDYQARQDEKPGLLQKAMITCPDREIAWELYKIIGELRPEWAKPVKTLDPSQLSERELEKLEAIPFVNLIATRDEKKDEKELYNLLGDAEHRKHLAEAFKSEKSNFHLAIVVDMWITGFDCPCLTYLYNYKPLQKHTLIQTISRVNRRYKSKSCGIIIDYIGIRTKMKEAMRTYGGGEIGEGNSTERDVDAAHKVLQTELAILRDLCHALDFSPFFHGKPMERLNFLQTAAEFVLANSAEGGERQAVSFLAKFRGHVRRLRAAYAICNPAGVLSDEETAWSQCFMGVLSFVSKIIAPERGDLERMNRTVERMVEEALTCSGVETVLGHEGGDEEYIFGDAFMREIESVDMPNTKFQLLVKLLKRVIRDYGKTNRVKAQQFQQMLEATVEEYNTRDKLTFANSVANDTVSAVSDEIHRRIEALSGELLKLLKSVEQDKVEFRKLGITFEEKAFYDILVDVRDRHQFEYPNERCKDLAKKIKQLVDDNSVYADWLNNFNLRNQLSTDLTTLLYNEGYPPDWDEEVFEKVLEQMENYKKNSTRTDD